MPNKEDVAKKSAETAKVEIDIIRGRMPLPLVFLIKFAKDDVKDADLASTHRTTSGKVSDIRKGRNFGYIDKKFKPTQEMVDAAKTRIEQYSDTDKEDVLEALGKLKVATEKEATAFAESRKGSRKPRGKDKAEEATGEEAVAEEVATETGSDEDLADLIA